MIQQTQIAILNNIRKIDSDCEFYSDMSIFLKELDADENIAPFLNRKLAAGDITSIEDLSEFFYDRYNDCYKKAQQLIKQL